MKLSARRSIQSAFAIGKPKGGSFRQLPLLEARRTELETCVFCPKLCRSACPVSNAEPRETLTPWGKMSMAYFAARGDVSLTASYGAPAWACTGCHACRGACEHRNEVSSTLFDARSELSAAGVAPQTAREVLANFDAHRETTRTAINELSAGSDSLSGPALLIGCSYAQHAKAEAQDAVFVARTLVGTPVHVVGDCCGLPLLLGGDKKRFSLHALAFRKTYDHNRHFLVVDAGCAFALRAQYPAVGVILKGRIELLVERAVLQLSQLKTLSDGGHKQPVRYHDPCQLGRGLGVFESPRAVLTRAIGRKPDEFDYNREASACSGAGGLVPVTMPDTSGAIARRRLLEHQKNGGGRIVTACASSLRTLRRYGGDQVDDIVTWIARAVRA